MGTSFAYRLYCFLYFQSWNLGLWRPPDRKFLYDQILASYAGRADFKTVLFVGVRRYTKKYHKLFKHARFITMEIDPSLRRFGASRHLSDDVLNLSRYRAAEFPAGLDLIIFNGVIGFGLNEKAQIEMALAVLAKNLREGGHLILGTNPHHLNDQKRNALENLQKYFVPIDLVAGEHAYRFNFPFLKGPEHEYRFYALRPGMI